MKYPCQNAVIARGTIEILGFGLFWSEYLFCREIDKSVEVDTSGMENPIEYCEERLQKMCSERCKFYKELEK